MIDQTKFQDLADVLQRETGEHMWIGQPWPDAIGCLQRGVDELIRQRDVAVKALAGGVHKELAPATADLLGKRVVSEDRVREFFNHIKHGDAEHVEWLRAEFEKFWGVSP